MAQIASLVINDREATPVAHTYVRNEVSGNAASFFEAAATLGGRAKLSVTWKQTDTKYKCRLILSKPVLVTEVINGISRNKIDRINYGAAEFTFDGASTLQERKNVVGLLANALLASQTGLDDTLTGMNGVS